MGDKDHSRERRARLDTVFFDSTVNTRNFIEQHTGDMLQTYQKIRTAGSGSFGTVVLVKDKHTEKRYACKCIPKKNFKPGQLEKFRLEIELVRRCDHPNIIKLYEFYEDKTHFYLIQEPCEGGELFDYITGPNFYGGHQKDSEEAFKLLEVKAALIFKQMMSGISYMHSRGIVHRDMKPENILLKHSKNLTELKIIDFGLSSKMTADGNIFKDQVGTPYYIAPEVIEKNYDEKCDIWSCGVILYILVSGQAPFNGPDDNAIIRKVRHRSFIISGGHWDHISNECIDLIKNMILSPPEARYSAQDCLNSAWMKKMNPSVQLVSATSTSSPIVSDSGQEMQLKRCDTQLVTNSIAANLTKFRAETKLKAAIRLCTSYRLERDSHVQKCIELFNSMDTNSNGTIDEDEFVAGYNILTSKCNALNAKDAEAEARNIFARMDINSDGFIEVSEWLSFVVDDKLLLSREKLKDAFRALDVDDDNHISTSELEHVLHDNESARGLMTKFDTDNDGKLDFDDFCKLIESI